MPCTVCSEAAGIEEIFHGFHVVLCAKCSAEALMESIGRGHWLKMSGLEDEMALGYKNRDPMAYESAIRVYYDYGNKIFLPWLIKFFREVDSGEKDCVYCHNQVEHLIDVEGFPLKPCLRCYYQSILSGVVLDRALLGRQMLLYKLKSPDYLAKNSEQLKNEEKWLKDLYRFYVKGS